MTAVGLGTPRSDADAKVRGLARYGVDYREAGMLHARLLRSPVAAGRITRLDVTKARSYPGVHAVVTADESPKHRNGLILFDTPFFAADTVLYEGEPIAMVVADTPNQARRAVEAIALEIEDWEPVSDVTEALAPGARLLHPDLDSYEILPGAATWPKHGNCGGVLTSDPGGVDEAFQTADVIVEDTLEVPRQYQAYLEPKSATASYDGWRWTIHVSHQFPFQVRSRVAQAMGVTDSRIRVVGHHMGGGFGARLDLGLEQFAAIGASVTGRTVQLVNDRDEDLISTMSRENATIRVRSGVTTDGRIVAREFECLMDGGAYAGDTVYLTSIPMFMVASVYRVGPTRVTAKSVYTNTAPSGAFRGVSGTYICFALERHTDRLAQAIGMDRREFRMRNLFESGDAMLNGQTLDDAYILREAFERVEEVAPWQGVGKGPLKGVGLAAVIWLTNPLAGSATLSIQQDGSLGVSTAATENGSGAVTMGVRQIAAAQFGLDAEQVFVTAPDTDTQGYDAGSQGSRTTHVVGMAVEAAAEQLKPRIFNIASGLLGALPDDLELSGGSVCVRDDPSRSVPLATVARTAFGLGGPLSATGTYNVPLPKWDPDSAEGLLFPVFPVPTYHVHLAEVEVDPDDGSVRVNRYVVAQEVGRMINPDGVYGQIQGGVAQGMGYALWEGLETRDGLYTRRTLESYGLPLAVDVPDVEIIILEHPCEAGPFGAKGAAEPPIVPVAAVIANAVSDATGANITTLPIDPEEVLEALDERREA
ncbi:MAG: xanthine dehydrogenase family protein molybdopterin-binding subunit [bacterium]|nr:xanthine dehydrogenase family protein molybdopterin-binding subunit [bacterium]MDE0602741.1 xanthine dehydrogenase family protein molybdopterin-binding subunit [bacterium]